MRRIGNKLTENGWVEGAPALTFRNTDYAETQQIMAACALYNSLIPDPDLERSGVMADVEKCEMDTWYYDDELSGWILASSSGAVHGCEEVVVFLWLDETGICSTFKPYGDEVELPRKSEVKEDDVPGLNPPTPMKSPMELIEERLRKYA